MRPHRLERDLERFRPALEAFAPARSFLQALPGHSAGARIVLPPVGDNLAIGYLDHPFGLRRNRRIMGDDDDGVAFLVQLVQQAQQFLAAAAVERARRLVGQNHVAAVHQGPRHADALLLAARQGIGPMV